MTTTARTGRRARAATLITAAAALAALLGTAPGTAARAGSTPAAPAGGDTRTAHAGHTAPASLPRTQSAALSNAPTAQTPAPTTAVEVRSTLERLLGAHVLLADELVRAITAGQQDRVMALSGSVDRNQQELVDAVTALGGAEAGQSFEAAWAEHVEVLAAYAAAVTAGDTAQQQSLRSRYTEVEQRLGSVLATLAGPSVAPEQVTAAAVQHGEHLLGQADAAASGAHDAAYAGQRVAFGHMIVVADVLARGIATSKGLPTDELDAPRRQLQTALSRLLAEHMGVMVQAMRAAQDRSPDAAAAGAAVNANTGDLGAAVGALYGEEASRQFLAIWAEHVEALIGFAGAREDAERDRLRQDGADYAPQLARFLAGATEQRLPAIDLAAALTVHDDHLRRQLDAYAEGDLDQAQAQAEQGYAHMFQLSQTLADAVGDAVAARLPQGGAATGGGGLVDGR